MRRLFIIFCISCELAAAQSPAESIYGTYSKAPNDTVAVVKQEDGTILVSCRLIFGAGQTCEMEGPAAWKNGVLTVRSEGLEENKPCVLEFHVAAGRVTVRDVQDNCRPVYCGTRGRFDGASLAKPVTKKKQSSKSKIQTKPIVKD